jgi:hypothetical protein
MFKKIMLKKMHYFEELVFFMIGGGGMLLGILAPIQDLSCVYSTSTISRILFSIFTSTKQY